MLQCTLESTTPVAPVMFTYAELSCAISRAAVQFLRSALSSETCVDVLLLAHHYQCTQLQAEAVSGHA